MIQILSGHIILTGIERKMQYKKNSILGLMHGPTYTTPIFITNFQ